MNKSVHGFGTEKSIPATDASMEFQYQVPTAPAAVLTGKTAPVVGSLQLVRILLFFGKFKLHY